MKLTTRHLITAAVIASLYTALTVLQNILLPGSTNAAIQFRISEALMMLALFSPSAIIGLTVGCMFSNLICGFPIDILIGSAATLLSAMLIYLTRNLKLKNFPLLPIIFTVLCNGIIIGAEIEFFYIGMFSLESFLVQIGLIAVGELGVITVIGIPLYYALQRSDVKKYLI